MGVGMVAGFLALDSGCSDPFLDPRKSFVSMGEMGCFSANAIVFIVVGGNGGRGGGHS